MAEDLNKVNILGADIDNVSFDEALKIICDLASAHGSCKYVVTPNIDHLVRIQNNKEFKKIYDGASLILADGVPLLWAAKFFGTPLKAKVSGSDLFPALCGIAAANGHKVFFLGGREGAAQKASDVLKSKYPALKVAGLYSPPLGFEKDAAESARIIKIIKDASPNILFVGLGSPKQEMWIARNSEACNVPVSIGIGVSFEFIAGMVKRAPRWMQKAGLEWFWRLMMEPGRLWKRYLVDDMRFFWLIIKQKFSRAKGRMT